MGKVSIIRRLTLCPLGMCPFSPKDDETGCWGECIYCGRRAGFVDRATLRAYADFEYEVQRSLEDVDKPGGKWGEA